MLQKLLFLSAWGMQTPKAYGSFHILFSVIGLVLVVGLAFHFHKADEKQNRKILLAVGLFLLATEVYKQLFYFFVIGNRTYPWWIFPFQLCSMPMYLCILSALLPDGEVRNAINNVMLAANGTASGRGDVWAVG